ncbi:XRE family transcriptional regulator [Streptomyces sp. NPDC056161]|uniref:XRE family transcriptional regulator n=1 Tax=Streptomyces sp. NPDC056161 TaxID=3345732 RepID=UPI0035E17E0F
MAAEDAYARLGETLERLAHAAGRPERLTDALDVDDLSLRAGVPEGVVRSLLDGGRADETSVAERVRQRLELLRRTRRRPDGRRYSVEELAAHAGVSRQTMSDWLTKGVPSLESADRLRRFFAQPPGFLTADEPEALNEALQPVLRGLEAGSDPLAALRTPEILRLAARAPHILPDALSSLSRWADMITCPDADGPGTGTEGSGPTGGDCR